MGYPKEMYEKYMVPALFEPWARLLVQFANPRPGERALDIACGTGIVSRHLVSRVTSSGRVTGVDINPEMLKAGRTAALQDHLPIEWVQGSAEHLGFMTGCFDLVICQFGLMFFTDRQAALVEMRRVLKQDGRLVLSVWQSLENHPFYQKIHKVSQRRLGTSGVQAAFSLGNARELRQDLEDAGFQQVEIKPATVMASFPNPQELLAWEVDVDPAAIPAVWGLDSESLKSALDAVLEELQAPLRETIVGSQAVIPFHAHIALARR